jgi:NAD(P)-dependent dehydrogenase (short-subunit alcohol dehydrogenase family)
LLRGYNVVATIVPNDPVPFEMADKKLEKIIVDLMSEDDADKFVQTAIVKYESIDAVVLTVSGFSMRKIADTKTGDIHKQYKLNFATVYNIALSAFVQMMRQKQGWIFLIGSRPGMDAENGKGMIAYGLAKSLIFRLAQLMNEEAKETNEVTSVVVASTIDTPQNRKAMPDKNFNDWVKPDDITAVIYYHCTNGAVSLRETVIKIYNNA